MPNNEYAPVITSPRDDYQKSIFKISNEARPYTKANVIIPQ
jgi:hypothetical protein